MSPEDAHSLARHVAPTVTEYDLSHLGAYTAAARLVVAGEETPAFTLRTRPAPPPQPGRAAAVRAASRTAHRRPRPAGTEPLAGRTLPAGTHTTPAPADPGRRPGRRDTGLARDHGDRAAATITAIATARARRQGTSTLPEHPGLREGLRQGLREGLRPGLEPSDPAEGPAP